MLQAGRLAGLMLVLGPVLFFSGCSSTVPNRNPLGELFPTVNGRSLDGTEHRLPQDLPGGKVLLLVGYVQDAQFDIDRWLLGLVQAEADLPVYEVPTIRGIFPGLIAGSIDEGMRKGIPREDWAAVVTVYDDAARIVDFTGNENPNNARVILLDASRQVVWFHDEGYSASTLMELLQTAQAQETLPAEPLQS